MSKKIKVEDYGEFYGPGRVYAKYDNGNPHEEPKDNSFDTITDALAWLMRIVAEEALERNAHVKQPFRTIVNNISDLPF